MSRKTDEFYLRRALLAAARVDPRATAPNPRVGCVIVLSGRLVASAAHKKYGGPHAEAAALKIAGARARGATAYVTLEPCLEFPGKKTPSCAAALADAGVRKVVFATLDPNPRIAGAGVKFLRRRGVTVEHNSALSAEALELNRGFFSRFQRRRPWVILKTALSLDGRAATDAGRSQWITGPAARNAAHELRAQCDAILVGANTVRADNPGLTAHGRGPNPLRVVLQGRGKISRRAKIFDAKAETIVFRREKNLRAVLRELAACGVGTLLVEGGPAVHASFLREGLVDEARVFLAPKLLSGARDPNKAPRVISARMRRLGDDWEF